MRIVRSSLLDPSPVEEDLADLSFISVPSAAMAAMNFESCCDCDNVSSGFAM